MLFQPHHEQFSILYSKASTFIKLAFLSVNNKHLPKWTIFVSFTISNLQTVALLLNNAKLYLPKQNDISSSIIEAYLKIFGFAEIFSYTNRTSVIIWAAIMMAYCLHSAVLLFYLSIKLKKQQVIPNSLQKYWSLIISFHPLVCFYPIHTFNLRVLHGCKLDTFTTPVQAPLILLFYTNIVINFLLAFFSTRLCYVVIETKDPLSCKNNSIRTSDILSKTLIPILWIFADDNEFLQVLIIISGFIDCLGRDFVLFYYLPYYSTEILGISALTQGATTALALVTLTARGISSSTMNLGQYFVHVSWIFMIPVFAKLYLSLLERILCHIICSPNSCLTLHYAIHKRYLLRYFMKRRAMPTPDTKIIDLSYFIFKSVLSQSESPQENTAAAADTFEAIKIQSLEEIKNNYLEILAQYPKSHVAKLSLANFYVTKETSYLLANNLIEEVLNDSPCFSIRVSLSLIRFGLQKKIHIQYSRREEESPEKLDLLFYVQITSLNHKLKQQIKHQVRKQVEFWENFSSNKPDMGILTDLALKIDAEKKDVLKTWKEMAKIRPSTFYAPPLVYGMYTSLANNNAIEGEKFVEQYQNDIVVSSKLLEVDELNNDTIMAEDTTRITMSGSRTKIGYILDCSTNINQVYGWKREFLINQPIVTIMPPYYQQRHDKFLLNHYNTGKTKLLNHTSILPVVNSGGYLKSSRVHIKMHPFVEQGIFYVAVLRRIKKPQRRMILVRKDGTVDAMSKNFEIDMNILKDFRSLDLLSCCPEFQAVNSAFNKKVQTIIGSNSPHSNTTYSSVSRLEQPSSIFNNSSEASIQVQSLYEKFITGAKLAFYPQTDDEIKAKLLPKNKIQHSAKPIFYNVQIVPKIHNKDFIKVLYLDPILDEVIFVDPFGDKTQETSRFLMGCDESVSSMRMKIPDELDENQEFLNQNTHIINNYNTPTQNQNQNCSSPKIIINQTKNSQNFQSQTQTDNSFRIKLQKIREKLERKPGHTPERAEASVTGSTISKGRRVQKLVFKALDMTVYRKPVILFCIGFFLLSLVLLTLQSLESAIVITAVDQLTSKTYVFANSTFRLSSFLSLAMYARYWYQGLKYSTNTDMDTAFGATFSYIFVLYTQDAFKYNKQMQQQLADIDQKYQETFYLDIVKMYETTNRLEAPIGIYSNFDAAGLLIDRSVRFIAEQSKSNLTSKNTDGLEFVLRNVYNDFLSSSEITSIALIGDLVETTQNTKKHINTIFAFTLGINAVFLLVVFLYFYNTNKHSNRFVNLFFQFRLHKAQEIKSMLRQFIHSLEANANDIEEIKEKYNSLERVKNQNPSHRSPLMNRFFRKRVLIFLGLLPPFAIMIIWALGYFFSTKSVLTRIQQKQNQLLASTTALYQQNLLITEFIELVATNATATVRNLPIEYFLPNNLESIKNLNQFINQFRDSNGELTPEEEAIFFSFPCTDFANYDFELPSLLILSCLALSDGTFGTSYTEMTTQLISAVTDSYDKFLTSNRTSEGNRNFLQETSDEFQFLALVAPSMCMILYKATLIDFEDQTDTARSNAIHFAIISFIGFTLLTILVWHFVVRKIVRLEAENKMILKLIPIPLLLENQYLKQYLVKNSNRVLDNVRTFMQILCIHLFR